MHSAAAGKTRLVGPGPSWLYAAVVLAAFLSGCGGPRPDDPADPEVLQQTPPVIGIAPGVQAFGPPADASDVVAISLQKYSDGQAGAGRLAPDPARVSITRVTRQDGRLGLLPFVCRLRDAAGRVLDERALTLGFGHERRESSEIHVRAQRFAPQDCVLEVELAGASGEQTLHASTPLSIEPASPVWDRYLSLWWGETDEEAPVPSIDGVGVWRLNAPVDAHQLSFVTDLLGDILAPYRDAPERLQPLLRNYAKNGDLFVWEREWPLSLDALNKTLIRRCEEAGDKHGRTPLFYSLALEPSLGLGVLPLEFDRNASTVQAFRQWLQQRYRKLSVLNKYWGSSFRDWSGVRAPSVEEGSQHAQANFAAWCDHQRFQRERLVQVMAEARLLLRRHAGRSACGVLALPPPVAGAGYDYSALAPLLDVVGTTGPDANLPLLRSLNGRTVLLSTIWRPSQMPVGLQCYGLWRDALDGARGAVFVGEAGALPELDELRPTLRRLRFGSGSLVVRGTPPASPIGILYSPTSVDVDWLRQVRADPTRLSRWRTDSRAARGEDRTLRLRESWLKLFEDLGHHPRFVSTAQLEAGALDELRVLVLPRAYALSEREIAALAGFAARRGILIQDDVAGSHDGLGHPHPVNLLAALFDIEEGEPGEHRFKLPESDALLPPIRATDAWVGEQFITDESGRRLTLNVDLENYLQWRLLPGNPMAQMLRDALRAYLDDFGLRAPIKIDCNAGRALPRIVRLSLPGMQLIALQRNWQSDVDVLAPQQAGGLMNDVSNLAVDVDLGRRAYVINLSAPLTQPTASEGRAVVRTRELKLSLPPWEPVILALLEDAPKPSTLRATEQLAAGHLLRFEDYVPQRRARSCYYELKDAEGDLLPDGRGVAYGTGGPVAAELAIDPALPPQVLTLQVTDLLTGQQNQALIEVTAPAANGSP